MLVENGLLDGTTGFTRVLWGNDKSNFFSLKKRVDHYCITVCSTHCIHGGQSIKLQESSLVA